MSAASLAALARLTNSSRDLILLAPAWNSSQDGPLRVCADATRYYSLLADMQRFRGSIYLEDGALQPNDLEADGRHFMEADFSSWHVVALDDAGKVCGCSRYRIYPRNTPFAELAVGRSALAKCDIWGSHVRAAVERERDRALQSHTHFVEVGGWAISPELRRSTEAVRIALATYALADSLGGCIGLTTATLRHHSATVLRKIGGTSLFLGETELPRYFDSEYECDMEILRFDSASPSPRFQPWIDQLRAHLASVEVITSRWPAKRTRMENPEPEMAASVASSWMEASGKSESRMWQAAYRGA